MSPIARARSRPMREYWFPALTSVFVLAVGSLPYLYGYTHTCAGKRFTGLVGLRGGSSVGYFMFARQAQEGYNLFENKFNPGPLPRTYFSGEWWLFGRAVRWTGLSYMAVFHVDRVLTVFLFCFAAYYLCALCLDSVFRRRVAFCLFVFNSGFGWLLLAVSKVLLWLAPSLAQVGQYQGMLGFLVHGPELRIARDISGASMFGYLINIPHFMRAAAFATLTIAFLMAGERTRKARYFVLSGLSALACTHIRPYSIPETYLICAVFPALISLKQRRVDLQLFLNCALAGFVLLPSVLQYAYMAHENTLGMAGWERLGGHFLQYIGWYGLPFVLLFLDFQGLARYRFMSRPAILLATWISLAFLIAQSYPHFRSGEESAMSFWAVPAILATAGPLRRMYCALMRTAIIRNAVSRRATLVCFRVCAAVLLVIFCGLSNLVTYARMFITLHGGARPYYVDADYLKAMKWLDVHGDEKDVVLAVCDTSSFVPWLSMKRTVTGHDMLTAYFNARNEAIARFYSIRGDDEFKRQFLREQSVTYVIVGPWEKSPDSGMMPADHTWLRKIFSSPSVWIYKALT